MQRFKHILFVTAGMLEGDQAFIRALSLMRRNEARLTVLSVVEEAPATSRSFAGLSMVELEELVMGDRLAELQRQLAPLQQKNLPVVAQVRCGTPFLEIIRQVLQAKHDLVIVSADGEEQQLRRLGSTTMHLLRKCPCPAWVIKPVKRARYARILAVVEMAPQVGEGASLNDTILQLATSLSAVDESELHIVHPWTLYGEEALRGRRMKIAEEEVEQILEEAQALRREWLEALLGQHRLERVHSKVHVIKGEARHVVPRLADELRAGLLILGTVGRTDVPGLLISDAAEEILRVVDCSVLGVKPAAFKSPVKLTSKETVYA